MSLADELKRLRKEAGLSQAALASVIGANQSFVSQLESGIKTGFGTDTLFRLCDALGVSCDHFRPFLSEPGGADENAAEDSPPDRPAGKRK